MFRILRGRGSVQVFCSKQRFCKVVDGVGNEKKIEIKKASGGKQDQETKTEEENKPYGDPSLPKHPGGICYNLLNINGIGFVP